MSFKAAVIPSDPAQTIWAHEFENYLDIQEAVGGTFDCVHLNLLGQEVTAWCHDEGLIFGMEKNYIIASLFGIDLRGQVVLSGGADAHGETLPLDPTILDALIQASQHTNS